MDNLLGKHDAFLHNNDYLCILRKFFSISFNIKIYESTY